MKDDDKNWPAWFYGPNGASQTFDRASDVPSGWQDHPSKVTDEPKNTPPPAQTGTTQIATVPAKKPAAKKPGRGRPKKAAAPAESTVPAHDL